MKITAIFIIIWSIFSDYGDALKFTIENPLSSGFKDGKVCYDKVGCIYENGIMEHLKTAPKNVNVKFHLYMPGNPKKGKIISSDDITKLAKFDSKKQLVFVTHGFHSSYKVETFQKIKRALLKYESDKVGAVIMVDWKKGAATNLYGHACANTEVVGRHIAILLEKLKTKGYIRPENVYLIGHSLGAHISGFAGKYTQSEYGWKIGRITGLDSASPGFEDYPGTYLSRDDADFVDAIHTSAGSRYGISSIGFIKPYAHVDFYPNNGKKQPKCGLLPTDVSCNHSSSLIYYEASIVEKKSCKFLAYPCKNWEAFLGNVCKDADVIMGFDANKYGIKRTTPFDGTNVRYLATNKKAPFCQ